MRRLLNRNRLLCLSIFFCAVFITCPDIVFSKPIFTGPEGTFNIYDVGTSRVKRLAKSVAFASVDDPRSSMNDMYMSIEFDLVTKDESNMVEPEGITVVHIPHFNDKAVRAMEVPYLIGMYDRYKIALARITARMDETNRKIDEVRASASTKKRGEMTEAEKAGEKRRWAQIEAIIDEMTDYYHSETEEYIKYVDETCMRIQSQDVYIRAEDANAAKKIKLKTFKEGVKGVFSLAGSIASVASGDLTAIGSLIGNTIDLLKFFKSTYSKKAEDLYNDYMELIEALDALERSHDESRIGENLARVERANNAYLNSLKKVDKKSFIEETDEIQQRLTTVVELLGTIKSENNTGDRQTVKKFTELKQQSQKLIRIKEDTDIVMNELQRPLLEADTIRDKKNTLMREKEIKFKVFQSNRSGSSGKAEGFTALIKNAIDISDIILSTVSTLSDAVK